MSSFINADLASDSDSDDNDFDPTQEGGEIVSEEENSGEDENSEGVKKKKKGKQKKGKSRKPGGIFLSDEDAEKERAENEAMRKEFEKEKEEIKAEVDNKKKEDIWAGKRFFFCLYSMGFKIRLEVFQHLCQFREILVLLAL